MKIAAIHATTMAIKPTEEAFEEISTNEDWTLYHFLDTSLVSMLQMEGKLTPTIIRHFSRLFDSAQELQVDCILLTCSAFNNVTKILQPLYDAKLFRSDEAMLDKALLYERIGLISTMAETPVALRNYLEEKRNGIKIKSLISTDAFELILKGKNMEHDNLVKDLIQQVEGLVDVIVLSQYSLAHLVKQVKVGVPILSGPIESAKQCIEYIKINKK